ncbi:DUF6328 family protein [Nocardia rhizosphaerihabitans]|uniref:DUF6328 family protein n=1 Tax=Nocardia rhizosphaerihabitans TaxID=1691570 RepID=UPI0036732996
MSTAGDDAEWDRQARGETEIQRLDRNWADLLQELRVVQTGVQLLTGFLLTLPFQARFPMLDTSMRVVYLVTVAASVAATVLLVAPVATHRLLFRRHQLADLVAAAHRYAFFGIILLGVALTGVTVLIFDTVAGLGAAIAAGICFVVLFIGVWLLGPLLQREREPDSSV